MGISERIKALSFIIPGVINIDFQFSQKIIEF